MEYVLVLLWTVFEILRRPKTWTSASSSVADSDDSHRDNDNDEKDQKNDDDNDSWWSRRWWLVDDDGFLYNITMISRSFWRDLLHYMIFVLSSIHMSWYSV